MATKKENKVPLKNKNTLIVALLIISALLNFYLYQKATTETYTEPQSIRYMGSKYKELLKSMPEDAAQTALIDLVKKDPLVIGSQKFSENNVDGISYDYCTNSRGAGHNSWANLSQ